MTAITLIQILEQQGFKLSIFGKSRLRIHPSSTGDSRITPEIMAELVEKRPQIIEHLRARATVQMASPQRPYEPPVIRVPGKPLTEQQLKFIEALTYALVPAIREPLSQANADRGALGLRRVSPAAITITLVPELALRGTYLAMPGLRCGADMPSLMKVRCNSGFHSHAGISRTIH